MRALLSAFACLLAALSFAASGSAQEIPELDIDSIKAKANWTPETDKAYLMVESRNRRPLITFVKLIGGMDPGDPASAQGYIEIPREKRLATSGDVSVWLFEVPAGDYALAGMTWQYLPQDVDCACMGSVRFSVATGIVTAIRVEHALLDRDGQQVGTGNRPRDVPDGYSDNDAFAARALIVGHPTSGLWAGDIAPDAIKPATFAPVPELHNWFGWQINRVMPISGVMGYELDRMVDLRGSK